MLVTEQEKGVERVFKKLIKNVYCETIMHRFHFYYNKHIFKLF